MPGWNDHRLVGAVATLSVLATAGCGTKNQSDVANVPQGSGKLAQDARPLRVADVEREPAGSARRAVMQLLYWGQWGSAPNIIASYDPLVRRRVGVSNIVGTYSQARVSLATSEPRIVDTTKTAAGTLVAVELLSNTERPAPISFLLRRADGGWRVVFDTLLESGLPEYARSQPDQEALARGRALARTYRDLFASRLDR